MGDLNNGKDFYSILENLDKDLASHMHEIREKGLDTWVPLLIPDVGSHAGYPHLRNVERIANRIIPDELKSTFSASEIFLLLSAIFLHDIGKTIPDTAFEEHKCSNDTQYCEVRDSKLRLLCNKPQCEHFKMSQRIINEQGIALGLPDEKIAKYCALLAFCHGLREPPTKSQPRYINTKNPAATCIEMWPESGDFRTTSLMPYGVLRIPLLASILRIADETDNSWMRALNDYWFTLHKTAHQDIGKSFRRCIEDIEFNHDGQCLILHVPEMQIPEDIPSSPEDFENSINNVTHEISTTLNNWKQELTKIGVCFDDVFVEHNNRLYKPFHLSANDIDDLTQVVGEKRGKTLKEILDAMIQLYRGSCGYPVFAWETLEAQVSRPLTKVDKWLASRIATASDRHIMITEQNEIHFNFSAEENNELEKIKQLILTQGRN
jgi:hypothetical protein